MSADAVHVESGAFKVDRRRALDKLMRFQLSDAQLFVLPWIRCAVAGGATRLRLYHTPDFVELRFDGRPFSRAELTDPYSCLFERHTADKRRNRELAIGLLSVLRLQPKSVNIASGEGRERLRLRVESVESDRLDPSEEPAADTALKVTMGKQPLWSDAQSEFVATLCSVSPVALTLAGREVTRLRRPEDRPGLYFEKDGVYGWLTVPPDVGRPSSFNAYSLGVFVCTAQAELPLAQFEGYVNDDAFTLNASQSGVARNSRFRRTMESVAGELERFLVDTARGLGARMEEAGREILDPDLRFYWRERLERGSAAEQPSPLEGAKETLRATLALVQGRDLERRRRLIAALQWTAREASWLRDACQRLLNDATKDSAQPVLKALWDAPVLLDTLGVPLSLRAVEGQRRRVGYVPVSREPSPGARPPLRIVWLSSPKDGELLYARFRDAVRDVSGQLDSLEEPPPVPEGAGADLDRAGVSELLVRDAFPSAGGPAEVGLSVAPHERSARFHFFRRGLPAGYFELEGQLRFDAAVPLDDRGAREATASGIVPPDSERAALVEAAAQAARPLYKRLLPEYDCWKTTPRNAAIREHLLDLLVTVYGDGRLPPPDMTWLETVPLFFFGDAWLDFDRLRTTFREGRPLYVAANESGARGLPGKLTLVGPRFTDEFLSRLLPDAAFHPVASKPLRLFFRRPPPPACGYGASWGCLVELEIGKRTVHLTLTRDAGSEALEAPWGVLYANASRPLETAERLALAKDNLAFHAVTALVKQRGTLVERPGSPGRVFLLTALSRLLAPWPGTGPLKPRQALLDLLELLPMFRTPPGAAWTLQDAAARLTGAEDVTYLPFPSPASGAADLVLDAGELELIEALWPDGAARLRPYQPPVTPRGAPAEASTAPNPAAPSAASAASPRAPEPAPAAALQAGLPPFPALEEPMLLQRRYSESGLEAVIGLPESSESSASATFYRNGRRVEPGAEVLAVPVFGAARIAVGKAPPTADAVARLTRRFCVDVAARWPFTAADVPPEEEAARAGLLDFAAAYLSHPAASPADRRAVRDAVFGAPLFRELGGARTSLDELASRLANGVTLRYATRAPVPCPAEARGALLLPKAQAERVAALLGAEDRLEAYAPAPRPARRRPPEPAPAEPAAEAPEPEAVLRLRKLFRRLRGRRGLKLRSRTIRLGDEASPKKPIAVTESGALELKRHHPLVMAVLASPLPADEQAAYLASILYTAANRELPDVTDADDIRFHEALLDELVAPEA